MITNVDKSSLKPHSWFYLHWILLVAVEKNLAGESG